MKTEHICMMTPRQAAMALLLVISDPALTGEDKEKIVEFWNDDVRRNRHEA